MFVSRNWLKDFVKIPDSLSAKELGLKLTMATAEVEGFVDQAESLKGVVVGQILEIKKHPNADKLLLAVVDIGRTKLSIVCGAPNIEVGQKVPVATIGAVLPSGMKIEKVKVRGEESSGMLCAQDELKLGTDHSGILILDKNLKVGEPLSKALGLDDVIYEIDNKSLTHRPDLWSQYGFAREVAAILGKELKVPTFAKASAGIGKLDIKIEDYKLCPRYEGVVIAGIEIAPSPEWMQKRIMAVGMRSINNIVDITNYVMWELGQPLHAFDYDKLDGHKIIVRTAKNSETIETLDDEKRKLDDSILVIADAKKPVAIAGVMGGANTEIDNKTKKIIIESANFDHVSIRKTEVKLGLRSEASIRFEKSLDPNLTDSAIKRAVELILQVCPKAVLASRIEDVKKFKLNQGPLKVSFDFLERRIGEKISPSKIIDILESLGFEVKKQKEGLEILVPTHRATKDISIPEDIVEEVARIYGYDNLPVSMPFIAMSRPEVNSERELERKIKSILSLGFAAAEVYNYSFVGEEQVKKLGLRIEDHVRISNPQAKEWSLLRRSLIPNLLESARLNARFYDDFSLFESGLTYIPEYEGEITSDKEANFLPLQDKWLGCLVTEKKNDRPFYIAKNILAGLLSRLHFDYQLGKMTEFVPLVKENRAVDIIVADREIGYITELPDELYEKLGLKNKVAYFELNVSKLTEFYTDEIEYKSIPKFPSIDLDISMIIPKNILWEEVDKAVREIDKDLIKEVTFFDVYEGAGIPENKKSIAFRIIYRSDDKTLTMAEVQIIHQKVLQILEKIFNAQIRK